MNDSINKIGADIAKALRELEKGADALDVRRDAAHSKLRQVWDAISRVARKPSKPLFKNGRCLHDRTISEQGRRIAPLRFLVVKSSQIPQYPAALAAARLRGELALQLCCNEMVFIPILDDPHVRNSGLNHAARS